MATLAFELKEQFDTIHCIKCGVIFCVPAGLIAQRKINGEQFYCPNGHPAVFKGGLVEVLRQQLNEAEDKLRWTTAKHNTVEKKLKQLKRRVANGVCPCCKRSFQNLARHMHAKHPEFQTKTEKDLGAESQ